MILFLRFLSMNSLILSRFNDEWNQDRILIDFMLAILMLKDSRFAEHSISHRKSKHFHLIYYRSFRDNLTDFLDFNSFLSSMFSDNYRLDALLSAMRYSEVKSSIKAVNSSGDEIRILEEDLAGQRKYRRLFLVNSWVQRRQSTCCETKAILGLNRHCPEGKCMP